MAVYAFASEDDFKRAVRAIKLSESSRLDITRQRGRWPVAGSGGDSGLAEGRLTTPLTPATNSFTGGITFSFMQYIDSGVDVEPRRLIADMQFNGVNRSTTLEAEPGVYIICAKINGEWRPIFVDSSNVCTD